MVKRIIVAITLLILCGCTAVLCYVYAQHTKSAGKTASTNTVTNQPPPVATTMTKSPASNLPQFIDNGDAIATPIYGIDSTIISKTNGLHIALAKILPQAEIPSEATNEGPICDYKLMDCIETNPVFQSVKEKVNTVYSIYSLDGKAGEAYGKYTMDHGRGYDFIVFDQGTPGGFFISGNHNHMPRPVTVYVDVKSNNGTLYSIQKYRDFDDAVLLETGRKLLGNDRPVVIAQYIECDLNNDGKQEKIVNFNNVMIKKGVYKDFYQKESLDKYYAVLAILDDHYQPIAFVHDRRSFVGLREIADYAEESYVYVKYLVDVDNDGQMELISYVGGYEWTSYLTSKLQGNKIESSTSATFE